MITFDKQNLEGKWFDYDDEVKFHIRPFKTSLRALRPAGNTITDLFFKQAMYCLIGWEGIKDVNGEEVKFTEDNKKFIFEYSEPLIEWVCIKSKEVNESIINITQKKT